MIVSCWWIDWLLNSRSRVPAGVLLLLESTVLHYFVCLILVEFSGAESLLAFLFKLLEHWRKFWHYSFNIFFKTSTLKGGGREDLIWSCNSSQIGKFLLSVLPVISKFSPLLLSDVEVELSWCLMDCIMLFGPSNFVCFPLAIQIMYKGFQREQICMKRMGKNNEICWF